MRAVLSAARIRPSMDCGNETSPQLVDHKLQDANWAVCRNGLVAAVHRNGHRMAREHATVGARECYFVNLSMLNGFYFHLGRSQRQDPRIIFIAMRAVLSQHNLIYLLKDCTRRKPRTD